MSLTAKEHLIESATCTAVCAILFDWWFLAEAEDHPFRTASPVERQDRSDTEPSFPDNGSITSVEHPATADIHGISGFAAAGVTDPAKLSGVVL
jgi:hypothetical protein